MPYQKDLGVQIQQIRSGALLLVLHPSVKYYSTKDMNYSDPTMTQCLEEGIAMESATIYLIISSY